MKTSFRISLGSLLALGSLLQARPMWAQSCVLCYTSVAASGSAAIRGFDFGILALLTPALLLFSAIFLLILRRARAADRPEPLVQKGIAAGNRARGEFRWLRFRRPVPLLRNPSSLS